MNHKKIAVLPGDGIGPEVMSEALKVLMRVCELSGLSLSYEEADIGGHAIDRHGKPLPEATLQLCEKSDAILFGSVGGPKWEHLPPAEQPERGALLPLRKYFDLYANLRYVKIDGNMTDISPLKNEIIDGGVDFLIIRELTGDVYFGQPKAKDNTYGLDTMVYYRKEVERIARLGFNIARKRKKKLTSVDKANVLSSMVFWREVISEVGKEYQDVELQHIYVDNMSMQLVKNPKAYDVILCPNMFGDILSDEGAVIAGSLGMLPSSSLSESGFGLYEPIGGSAPDIAGKNLANPIAQILCLALLFRHSLGQDDWANKIEQSIKKTLNQGYRTRDLLSAELGVENKYKVVGTSEMGDAVIANL